MTTLHLTLKMTTAQAVETPVINNSLSKDYTVYSNPDDHTRQTRGLHSYSKYSYTHLVNLTVDN